MAGDSAASEATQTGFLEYHEPDSTFPALTIVASILSSMNTRPTATFAVCATAGLAAEKSDILSSNHSLLSDMADSMSTILPAWHTELIAFDAPGKLTVTHLPTVISLLILISFFFFLSFAEWFSDKIFRAGLIGQIIVGLIYGLPLANIMPIDWQETFVSLGYIGLILIIFEGGLTVRLDLLKKNFLLSLVGAIIGVVIPIGLCYCLLYIGFGYGAVETFIIGAALSTTSLGTTFVVIASAARGIDFAQTKIGIVLISAAVFDDVSGLVMASVIHNLGGAAEGNISIAWLIGRPVVASAALGICSPLLATYVFGPFFRWYVEDRFARYKHVSNIVLMVLVLCAFISIAAFAGTSVLFGSFMAGTFLSSLPCIHPDAPFMVMSREHGETAEGKTPTFVHTFEKYFLGAQTYILQPMFFASIGFAIPFKQLWTPTAIWRGIVFTILMLIGKVLVGAAVPMWDAFSGRKVSQDKTFWSATWPSALFLGMAMVARGEIGLLIIQIGLNETPFLSQEAFITAAWAIVLNTIIGPVVVGLLLQKKGRRIAHDERWGIQLPELRNWTTEEYSEDGNVKRWTSRRHSRSVSRPASARASHNNSRNASLAPSVISSHPRGRAHSRSPSGPSSPVTPTSPAASAVRYSATSASNNAGTLPMAQTSSLGNPRTIEFGKLPQASRPDIGSSNIKEEGGSVASSSSPSPDVDIEKGNARS